MRDDMTMMLLTFVWMVTVCALGCALFVYVREARMWKERAESAMGALKAIMGGRVLTTMMMDEAEAEAAKKTAGDDDPVH